MGLESQVCFDENPWLVYSAVVNVSHAQIIHALGYHWVNCLVDILMIPCFLVRRFVLYSGHLAGVAGVALRWQRNLDTLDLSRNQIANFEGLQHLDQLTDLWVSLSCILVTWS